MVRFEYAIVAALPAIDMPPDTPPEPRKRGLQNLVIAAILAFQIITPLRYYLGARGYDERFSWRMFSTLRLRNCKVVVTERVREAGRTSEREVDIERDIHVAWLRLLERMRGAVVDAYLERRCDANDLVEQVDFECSCQDTDGTPLLPMRQTLDCEAQRARDKAAL